MVEVNKVKYELRIYTNQKEIQKEQCSEFLAKYYQQLCKKTHIFPGQGIKKKEIIEIKNGIEKIIATIG